MPDFVSFAASIAKLARGEKSHTHSLTYSSSLFDATGTEAFASELAHGPPDPCVAKQEVKMGKMVLQAKHQG